MKVHCLFNYAVFIPPPHHGLGLKRSILGTIMYAIFISNWPQGHLCFEGSPTASGSSVCLAMGLKQSTLGTIMYAVFIPKWLQGLHSAVCFQGSPTVSGSAAWRATCPSVSPSETSSPPVRTSCPTTSCGSASGCWAWSHPLATSSSLAGGRGTFAEGRYESSDWLFCEGVIIESESQCQKN